ncbi:MAG: hypothetical protein WCE88_02750, partial [Burkholderiales bacterium]
FPDSRGYYHPGQTNWEDYLYPANILQGKQRYYYALAKLPSMSGRDAVLSYAAFLNLLDEHNSQEEL